MSDSFTACVQTAPGRWLAFDSPALILQADSPGAVRRTVTDVEQLTRDGALHAVGFLTFEAGAAFGLPCRTDGDMPFAWFALFDAAHVREVGRPSAAGDYQVGPLSPSVDRAAFSTSFERIKAHLAAGDTYQVNLTFRMTGRFTGDPWSLFADLCEAQRGTCSAFVDLGDRVVCSASPELFFELQGADIVARPMKGTARRGLTSAQDRAAGRDLAASEKNRAENVMVVDMVRNDIGRVADVGTVTVPELFTVERYPNVWQMTSLVSGRSLAPIDEIFAALHPSASITGAPKVRTMEILREIEREPRGVYTGAIGHIPPDGLARFNVGIRTAVVDRRASTVSFGIGSGIVWDSDADAEYEECLLKGSILGRRPVVFELLETLRWSPGGGYLLLERHLARLADAAEYFGRDLSLDDVRRALDSAVAGASQAMRVRLLVDATGGVRTESQPHAPAAGPLRVVLASSPIDRADPFLYHKTTNRAVYERARAAAPEADEVLLWNGDRQVTEATTANVVVELGGRRITPPVECGLLAGTFRAELLATGAVEEAVVTIDDLEQATRVWLVNAVHEWRDGQVIDPGAGA